MIPRMCIHLPYFLKSCPSPMLLISISSQVHVWVQKDMTVAQMFPKSTALRHHPQRAPVEAEEGKFVLDKIRPSYATSLVYSLVESCYDETGCPSPLVWAKSLLAPHEFCAYCRCHSQGIATQRCCCFFCFVLFLIYKDQILCGSWGSLPRYLENNLVNSNDCFIILVT